MVAKWFLGSLFFVGAIYALAQVGEVKSAEDKAPDAKAVADCCKQQLACCKTESACCVADVKLGCCEKGMKCCAENRACCQAIQKCCLEGKACCVEGKACCGPKPADKAANSSVLPTTLQAVKKCCAKQAG
jgi:hypothetical protein